MISVSSRGLSLVAILALSVASGACNDIADCPSASSIRPGASCSGDQLECPYDLRSSDGTTTATSCTCVSGTWSCPAATEDDGGADGDDGTTAQEGGAEAEAAPQSPDANE